MPGVTLYAGAELAPIGDGTLTEITLDNTQNFNVPFRIGSDDVGTAAKNANTNDWIFDSLVMTAGATTADPGGVSFRCYNQQRIDLTGMLQLGAAYVPLGSASQRAGVPQLPGRYKARTSEAESLTYMRDFTIWSVEPLTASDRNLLWSDFVVRQSALPNMPHFVNTPGSMSTTQMLSSQSRLFVLDGALSSRVGFMRELFNQMGGMGETAAAPHIYCTRLISGQFLTCARGDFAPALTKDWTAEQFWISFPPSWELLNVAMIEPDELEYLTYMQRSVLAPGGRNPGA